MARKNNILGNMTEDLVRGGGSKGIEDQGYALDFIESPQGLNMKLYPAQRLIVKCVFGIPVDYKEQKIVMWDSLKQMKVPKTVSESEFLHILHDQGRCNVDDWRDIPPWGFGTSVIFAGRRGGKLLGVDELIPTPTGFKRNGDLVDGDLVFGEDGKPHEVLYAHPIEEAEAFKVSFDDGTFTYAHAGHLWHTYTHNERKNLRRRKTYAEPVLAPGLCECGCGAPVKSGKRYVHGHHARLQAKNRPIDGGVRTTAEIAATLKTKSSKEESNHAIKLASAVELPERPLPIDPYCFGFWLGDGNADSAILTCGDEDSQFVGKQFIDAGYSFEPLPSGLMRYSIRGIGLCDMGVLNNKHIPHDYLWSSVNQRLSLLQGLMDSDGHGAKDGAVEFCNTNLTLAEGVYHLAASLGLKPHFSEGIATLYGKDCGPKYRVTWTASLPVFRLPRKLAALKSIPARPWSKWRYITSVEPVGKMQMRCITTTNPTHLYLFGKNFNVTHNSQLVSAIAGSCLRNLLAIYDPQEYYKLVPGSTVDFTFIGTDEDSSTRLYDKLKADVIRSAFFAPYMVKSPNMTEMGFLSEADRARRIQKPSINVAAFACTTRAVRGPSSYFLALDEFQHFRSGKDANSDDLYKAATPSTSQFPNADDPERADSRILVISSPLGKIGKMYDLHKTALERGVDSDIFTIRLSTAEMNPRLPAKKLAEDYQNNPETFPAEFGGEFIDGSGSYVPPQKFDICVIPGKQNIVQFTPHAIGRKYFWGFDFGTQNDATALAISHLELIEGKSSIVLVYDYIDRMMVGEEFTGPGVKDGARIKDMKELDVLNDVVPWLVHMNNILPCYKGMMDQHSGTTLKQLLHLNSITTIELIHLTDQINSLMYFALKGYIDHGNAWFPDVEKFKKEFKQLVAEYKSKYVLRVQAPTEKGAHDDMADAVAESAYLAQKWIEEEGKLELDPTASSIRQDPRIANPCSIIDPNNVSTRDLNVIARQDKITREAFLPPGIQVVTNPFARGGSGRGRR